MSEPIHPDTTEHFRGCIECHKVKYGTPGMTAGEFERFLPDHLKRVYWEQKLNEYFATELKIQS